MHRVRNECIDSARVTRFENVYRSEGLSLKCIRLFRDIIYQHYRDHARRSLPWRKTRNPYHILVSEIMLQQTQVERVMQKYDRFISTFPDFTSLSKSPFSRILSVWQGLGYNRRAIALKKLAQKITSSEFSGKLPSSPEVLMTLPGIGRATASAVAAFAFKQPVVFIETNIRRVFLYFFFRGQDNIRDSVILPFVEKTLDSKDPRQWYFGLMDYGSMLKKTVQNPNRRSAHYQKQSSFEGSDRQVRGLILKALLSSPNISEHKLIQIVRVHPLRVRKNLVQLQKEGFIKEKIKRLVVS